MVNYHHGWRILGVVVKKSHFSQQWSKQALISWKLSWHIKFRIEHSLFGWQGTVGLHEIYFENL